MKCMRKSFSQTHQMGKKEAEAAIVHFIHKAIKSGRPAHPLLRGISSEFWENKRNLRRALVLLHIATGKKYGMLSTSDLIDRGLIGLAHAYDGIFGAVLAAGLADIRPWELHPVQPSFWTRPEFRRDALKWAIGKMKKERKTLSALLIENHNLSSLFYGYYESNFSLARVDAKEAGIKSSELINAGLPSYIGILRIRHPQA
jgi:hypothetical protein